MIVVAINIRNKVLFNIECFKNFLPISSIPFTISGAQFKEAGYSNITFNSGNYLIMWVTFDVSTYNRMIKLTIASKRSELHYDNYVANLEAWALDKYVLGLQFWWLQFAEVIEMSVPTQELSWPQYYEITLEKCICVSRTFVSIVLPTDKN